jgi:hypothetical protein
MAVDQRLGEIDKAAFAAEHAAVAQQVTARQAAPKPKPVTAAQTNLYRQLGPNGGISAAAASVLARVIVDIQERIAALEAAQNTGA